MRVFLILLTILLTGCANPFQAHVNNISLAFRLNQDVSITKDEVQQSKVELALIKSGPRPQALIAKAFNESGKDKWISEDRAMLSMQNGRVIRTLGFTNDLLALTGVGNDPLSDLSSIEGKSWQWLLDWGKGEYGYLVESHFSKRLSTISIFESQFEVIHVVERCEYKITHLLSGNEANWENEYWFHRQSGKLLRSSQQSAPFSDRFVISYVSNAVSLSH